MSSSDRRAALALIASAALAALAGCGFQLRRAPPVPFSRIALRGFLPRSPLAEELARTIAQVAEVVSDPTAAQAVLESITDQREKVVVSTTASAQVREVQLRVRFKFRLLAPGGRELLAPDELLLTREMSYNETNALAKEQEEAELYRAMQSDIVAQVMRRLSAAKA